MTKATHTNDHASARDALSTWKNHLGYMPFADARGGFGEDRCLPTLAEATSLLSMLSAACSDAATLGDKSEFAGRNMEMLARALSGVGTLIDLAAFMVEE